MGSELINYGDNIAINLTLVESVSIDVKYSSVRFGMISGKILHWGIPDLKIRLRVYNSILEKFSYELL